jgi:hypothetical protein
VTRFAVPAAGAASALVTRVKAVVAARVVTTPAAMDFFGHMMGEAP